MFQESFNKSAPYKVKVPIGACMDIPTGSFVQGRRGEMILNGGRGPLTGIGGTPNVGKSTLAKYLQLAFAAVVRVTQTPRMMDFETEMTMDTTRHHQLNAHFPPLSDIDLIDEGHWMVTDKSVHSSDEWYSLLRKILKDKCNGLHGPKVATPFYDHDKKTPLMVYAPSDVLVDSLTEFETVKADETKEKHNLGASELNMLAARQAAAKKLFMSDLPPINLASGNYTIITAHIGEFVNYDNNPMSPKPIKKLAGLASNKKIKGVSENFLFLTSDLWEVLPPKPCVTKDREVEYPEYPEQKFDETNDLRISTISQLRGKGGGSSVRIELIISQTRGVQPTLTELHNLRTSGYFGLIGGTSTYAVVFYPQCKFSRKTARLKIKDDRRLRRAIQLASELQQVFFYKKVLYSEILCSAEQLYEDIKELGYDWDEILQSVNFYGFDDYVTKIPTLSIIDLLRMRKNQYVPYWMGPDKRMLQQYKEVIHDFERF